ncbi:hypothetical protein HYQ46_008078 [Verticillium longisporum]|nr:hypothetical protein HYQ46_008078 [Verticillium longisporum]
MSGCVIHYDDSLYIQCSTSVHRFNVLFDTERSVGSPVSLSSRVGTAQGCGYALVCHPHPISPPVDYTGVGIMYRHPAVRIPTGYASRCGSTRESCTGRSTRMAIPRCGRFSATSPTKTSAGGPGISTCTGPIKTPLDTMPVFIRQ